MPSGGDQLSASTGGPIVAGEPAEELDTLGPCLELTKAVIALLDAGRLDRRVAIFDLNIEWCAAACRSRPESLSALRPQPEGPEQSAETAVCPSVCRPPHLALRQRTGALGCGLDVPEIPGSSVELRSERLLSSHGGDATAR